MIAVGAAVVWIILSAVLYRQFFKRFYDIVLSATALVVLSPVYLILTITGAIAMKGNPFFAQKRPGKRKKLSKKECAKRGVPYGTYGEEKIIRLFKFRTMTNEKDSNGELLPDERRMNKYGVFLRSTSLDELPSMFNILFGNMSFVGPRPLLVRYLPFYTKTERNRHNIRPGLTGLAQVNGRNYLSWGKIFEYDLKYIENYSLLYDIKIIFSTVFKVLKREDITSDTSHKGCDKSGRISCDPLDVERGGVEYTCHDISEADMQKTQSNNNNNKAVAIIGDGIIAEDLIRRAKELGIEAYCFGLSNNARIQKLTSKYRSIDIFDIDEIARICKEGNVGGVVATTELTIVPTAKIADKLGLLGNDVEISEKLTDKYYIRQRTFGIKGLSQPKVWEIQDESATTSVDVFPVIVKPDYSGGKRGITIVNSQDELKTAIDHAFSFTRNRKVLIEQFIADGKEYSVETLSYKGEHKVIQITEKDSSGPPRCVELGHHQPANLSDDVAARVKTVISGALTAIGFTNGPTHTEIKISDEDIYIIEINCRPGGDFITYPLTELSSGYPFLTAILYGALGILDREEIKTGEKGYSGVYFVTKETEYLKSIFDSCDDCDWLYEKHIESSELTELTHNDCEHLNYMIYYSKDGKPTFER